MTMMMSSSPAAFAPSSFTKPTLLAFDVKGGVLGFYLHVIGVVKNIAM
jgi:hypothetical protein